MDRHAAALVLNDIGTLLELQGEDRFRAQAFRAAARALDAVEGELEALVRDGGLEALPGLGPATAGVVRDLVEHGESSMHRRLRQRTPSGLVEMLAVPGLGARRIHLLHEALGVDTLEDLERAAQEGSIAALAGFGARSQAQILAGVGFVRGTAGRVRQPEAFRLSAWLIGHLEGLDAVRRVQLAGALRRRMETVAGVDVVVETRAPDVVVKALLELPGASGARRTGPASAAARFSDGVELRLSCAAPESFAAAWIYATGNEAHVKALEERARSRGLELSAAGLVRAGEPVPLEDELQLYQALGLAWLAPELREGTDEVARAAGGGLPDLVDGRQLHGCFHCHTTYSDGKATVHEMAGAARARGWRYLGIADHSRAAGYAGGLTPEEIERQHGEIDAWNEAHGEDLWLFKGIEADILPDGTLDYADEGDLLDRFDYVVGSIHSGFGRSGREMTARVLRALEDPRLTFLGHPTGRLLLSREGYPLDVEAVLEAAARLRAGIEINADPHRLDLDWRWWRRAAGLGVRCAINPDAHSTAGLDNVEYGVGMARKGWLQHQDVVNAWDLVSVQQFFHARAT